MILEEVRREVSKSDYYGHMVDETTDVSTKNQMSVIIRFVDDGEVRERFLGFYNVSELSGESRNQYCTDLRISSTQNC